MNKPLLFLPLVFLLGCQSKPKPPYPIDQSGNVTLIFNDPAVHHVTREQWGAAQGLYTFRVCDDNDQCNVLDADQFISTWHCSLYGGTKPVDCHELLEGSQGVLILKDSAHALIRGMKAGDTFPPSGDAK